MNSHTFDCKLIKMPYYKMLPRTPRVAAKCTVLWSEFPIRE